MLEPKGVDVLASHINDTKTAEAALVAQKSEAFDRGSGSGAHLIWADRYGNLE